MARSLIVVTDIVRAGTAPIAATVANATDDHYFTGNDGNVFLEIISTDGSSQTVEIVPNPTLTADGLTVSNLTITIPANSTRFAGPFKVTTFKQNAALDVYVNPSVSTTLTFRAWRLPSS